MAKSRSRTRRSKSRSSRGGAQVFGGGSSWAPAASNMHRDLTAPSAIGNHFKLSPQGVGGFQPPVPAMSGPGAGQFNKIWPPLGFKGGFRQRRSTLRRNGKSSRSKNRKGGLFQLATNSVRSLVNGYNGTSQPPSPWPWVHPELAKPHNIPLITTNLNTLKPISAANA